MIRKMQRPLRASVTVLAAGLAFASRSASASYVISGTNSEGVTTDKLDVAQGGSATASSVHNSCCGTSDPNEAIGLTTTNFVENTHFIFNDGNNPVGPVDILDITPGAAFHMGNYDIILATDGVGSDYRGATSFTLLAGPDFAHLSTVDSGSLGSGDYSALPGAGGNNRIDIHGTTSVNNVGAVELQLTRAVAGGGPRVIEVDAFVPEPASLSAIGLSLLGLLTRRRRA